MAIDLASSLSSFEFKNMLPLDVLAAVASKEFRNEIKSPSTPEIKTSNSAKRQVKKCTTSVLTFEDIKSMPAKLLVDKFSEMTSDEYSKKYYYKCMLFPQICAATFGGFGNEEKACDKMKSHLQQHVQQLVKESESTEGLSITEFIPKSPNSKHAEKVPRKCLKKQQMPLDYVLSRRNSSKTPKKRKNPTLSLKTVKKKVMENKKSISEIKNTYSKIIEKDTDSVHLKQDSPIKQIKSFISKEKTFFSKRVKKEIPEQFDQEFDSDHYNSYSTHLKIAFFTDVEVKEEIDESHSGSEEVSDTDRCHEHMNISSDISNGSFDKSHIYCQDHNYACEISKSSEAKTSSKKPEDIKLSADTKISYKKYESVKLSSEPKISSKKYEDPFLYQSKNDRSAYLIKTPPFPFLYNPVLPEVAEIIEIAMEGTSKYSDYVTYLWDSDAPKTSNVEEVTDESASDHEEKHSGSIFNKMSGPSGSVLECVENIENKKHSNNCMLKSEILPTENDENLENQQKNERELALKYISQLHSKGKKKVSEPLACQICTDKHFTAQATLIHHYRSHAGIKPYICEVCSSKFTRQHSLNYHMLIHKNESRFTCEFCQRNFRHPSHYKEHLRRHTGETPYHCTDCNLHFKTRNTFKRHLKTRHGKLLTAGGIADLNTA